MFGVSLTPSQTRPKWLICDMGPYDHMTSSWRMREEPNKKRARENILEYASREPIDAMHSMRQWGEKVDFTVVCDRGVEV